MTSLALIQQISTNSEAANDAHIALLLTNLADAIVDATSARIPINTALWTRETIAEYLSYTKSVVSRDIITQPDFPEKLDIGTGRWKASEVIEWSLQRARSSRSGRKRRN